MNASATSRSRARKRIIYILQSTVIILSVGLIVFISYDTFKGIPFLSDKAYMRFQLFVCLAFIADLFIRLHLTPRRQRGRYLRARWFFIVLSIPYLNIVDITGVTLSANELYFARFLPLARGALAITIVLNYITSNRISGLFMSYLSILVLSIYFAGLIFYDQESPVNPGITSYWDAFLWCCMEATTLGAYVTPVTVIGKVLASALAIMGMAMFPLFTVYLTHLILRNRKKLNDTNNAQTSVKTGDSVSLLQHPPINSLGQTQKNP